MAGAVGGRSGASSANAMFVSWIVPGDSPVLCIQYALDTVIVWTPMQRKTSAEHACARCGQLIPKGTILARPAVPPNSPIRHHRICVSCIGMTEEEVYGHIHQS